MTMNIPWGKITRAIGMLGTATIVLIYVREPSFPTPDKIVVFGTFLFMSFGQAKEMLRRFLPFLGLLLAYESLRGLAPLINAKVNYLFMPWADRLMAGGALPTKVLQDWFWSGTVRWYDFAYYLMYMLHFVFPFALAVVVWKTRVQEYWRVVTAYVVVSFAGFATFVAFPAAPPWMASEKGLIEPIERVSSHIWYALGVHDFPSVYNKITPNTVAAVPSLHAAYATLFAMFVTQLWRSRWRYVAWVYPVTIYVGTVYSGEHYVIDELLGALYAAGAFYAAPHVLRYARKIYAVLQQKVQQVLHRVVH